MSVQNGDVVLVTIGGVTVGALVSNGHNQLADMLDASNKDTAGIKQFKPGETGWNFTLESLYDPAATEGVSEALGYLKAGTSLTVTHGISGTSIQQGSGYISSIEVSGPKNEIGSYSLEIQGTGAVAVGYGPELHTNANAASDPYGNETDAVTGWTSTGLTGTGANVFESQNSVVDTGSYAFHAEANDTPTAGCNFTYYKTGLTNNGTYRVTGRWRHVGTGGKWVGTLAGIVIGNITNAETTWVDFSLETQISGTTTSITFAENSATNDGGIYIDNVSFKKKL